MGLRYYFLVRFDEGITAPKTHDSQGNDAGAHVWYRCAIDLYDHKRRTARVFLLNDIFRLLDLRHEIHEKAVTHRVVHSANAMLARGLNLLGREKRPSLKELIGLGSPHQALCGEDLFFASLLKHCSDNSTDPKLRAR